RASYVVLVHSLSQLLSLSRLSPSRVSLATEATRRWWRPPEAGRCLAEVAAAAPSPPPDPAEGEAAVSSGRPVVAAGSRGRRLPRPPLRQIRWKGRRRSPAAARRWRRARKAGDCLANAVATRWRLPGGGGGYRALPSTTSGGRGSGGLPTKAAAAAVAALLHHRHPGDPRASLPLHHPQGRCGSSVFFLSCLCSLV
ncbi:Os05g0198950, partial [Oryza sativa Japonica Group]